MDVDHGFSQALKRLLGGVNTYPVLPIFVSCLQPPFSPFARARALGEAVGSFARTLGQKRILFMGTGGLAHNPYHLFPPIDEVQPEWRPYIGSEERRVGKGCVDTGRSRGWPSP